MELQFGHKAFFIDLNAFEKATRSRNKENLEEREVFDGKGILTAREKSKRTPTDTLDSVKYEMLKMFIEFIIDFEDQELDDVMGAERALNSAPLGYKIVFNTLVKEGIIKVK